MKITLMAKKDMTNTGPDIIWFTGSRKHIRRNVYRSCDNRYYIVWYGEMIEVAGHWHTVEKY